MLCLCVCYSTSHFSRNYTHHKSFLAAWRSKILSDFPWKYILPSKVMASFTYHGQRPRRYFVFPLTVASLIPKSLTRSSALPTTRCKAASYFSLSQLKRNHAWRPTAHARHSANAHVPFSSHFGSLCSLGIGSKYASEGMSAV